MAIKKILGLILAAIVMLSAVPADAAKKRPQFKQFEAVQSQYASAIRWNEFEMAWGHIDPAYRKENPLSDLEKERLKQIQVTGYTEKTQDYLADGSIEQTVEIRLINRNTQAERKVFDTQIWRWDEKVKRWWLTTGLPDFTAKSF
jgi:hypothetical protein